MNITLKILLLLLLTVSSYAIEINSQTTNIDVLSKAKVFYDDENRLTISDVKKIKFRKSTLSFINLGIAPNTALWIKFTLTNTTNKELYKILEYLNPETEEILFYSETKLIREGMFHHQKSRKTINPIFEIRLKPFEEKTYYIKAHCKISTMIAGLKLYNETDFLHQDFKHTLILFIFFSVIMTLLLYNLMIFVFTKDIAYFYYVLYLSTMLFFEAIYLGIAQLYFFSNAISEFVTKGTIGYISLLVIPIILFTMEFLNTQKFPRIHLFFKLYLYSLPIVSLLSFDNFIFDLNIMVIFFPLAFMLIFAGIYSYSKGVKEAQYYLVGWTALLTSLTLSVYESMGGNLNYEIFEYMNEFAFMFEAFMFSIALAHRIKINSQAKHDADEKLINFQKKEQGLLETLVSQKTSDLQASLQEKEILYKELNHRVKNNLQMILSLIKLQIAQTSHKTTKEELLVTQTRINSIAELYEIFHLKDDMQNFETLSYFQSIVKNIQENFSVDVLVNYEIKHNVSVDDSIYCGLILNELVTNAFKYAFVKNGIITISTYTKKEKQYLVVEDNGVGYKEDIKSSLGLTIVKTLSQKQLNGEFYTKTDKGVKTTIQWSNI